MRRLRYAVGMAGALAAGVGAVAVVRPTIALETAVVGGLTRALADLGVGAFSLVGAGLVSLALAVSSLAATDERLVAGAPEAGEAFERTIDRRPETVQDAAPRTARDLDVTVDRGVAGDSAALERVRDRLADAAVAALAADDPEARRAVETGAWTDDRTAAAFLGRDGPTPSLRSRLRLWLDPETERERRVDRTVACIDRLDGDDR